MPFSSFMDGFVCKRCGFCCQLDVRLDNEDILRLEKEGEKDFVIEKNNMKILRQKKSICMFYEKGNCLVYSGRPGICRSFPFLANDTISEKCRQRKDFASRVERRFVEMIIRHEEETRIKEKSNKRTRRDSNPRSTA